MGQDQTDAIVRRKDGSIDIAFYVRRAEERHRAARAEIFGRFLGWLFGHAGTDRSGLFRQQQPTI